MLNRSYRTPWVRRRPRADRALRHPGRPDDLRWKDSLASLAAVLAREPDRHGCAAIGPARHYLSCAGRSLVCPGRGLMAPYGGDEPVACALKALLLRRNGASKLGDWPGAVTLGGSR